MCGLQYLHSYGIVHRDLKLENIMMTDATNKAVPKLVDFGLAKMIGPNEKAEEPFGTLGYVAPEIVSLTENVHIEPQCDIFSAGVIFHIFLMRKPLFEGTKYD